MTRVEINLLFLELFEKQEDKTNLSIVLTTLVTNKSAAENQLRIAKKKEAAHNIVELIDKGYTLQQAEEISSIIGVMKKDAEMYIATLEDLIEDHVKRIKALDFNINHVKSKIRVANEKLSMNELKNSI